MTTFLIVFGLVIATLAGIYSLLMRCVMKNFHANKQQQPKPLYKLNGRRIELQFDALAERLEKYPIEGLPPSP